MIDDYISLFLSKNLVTKTPPQRPRYRSDHQHLKTAPQLILEEQGNIMDKSLTKISKNDLKKLNINIPKQNKPSPLSHQPRSAQMSKILSPSLSKFNNYQSQQAFKRKMSKFELLHSSVKLPCSQLKEELVGQLESKLLLLKKIHQDRLEENEKLKLQVLKKESWKKAQVNEKQESQYESMEKKYIQQNQRRLNLRKQELSVLKLEQLKSEYQRLKQKRVQLSNKSEKMQSQIEEIAQQSDKCEMEKEILTNEILSVQWDLKHNRKCINNDYILKIMGIQFQIENKLNKMIQHQNESQKKRSDKIAKIKELRNKIYYEEQLFQHQLNDIRAKKSKYQ